jgi:hypothetical protein
MQNDVEFIRHFHHRSMTAFVNEIKLAVWYQAVELPATNGGVIVSLLPHINNVGCLI